MFSASAVEALGSGMAPYRRNAAGAYMTESSRICGVLDTTHVRFRNRSGSFTHSGTG